MWLVPCLNLIRMPEKVFYSIPVQMGKLVKGEQLEKCDLEQSVRQNLRLLLMTPPLRVRHDPLYQCKIHWQQFLTENGLMEEDQHMEDGFKNILEKNIKRLIEKFEPRIQLSELHVNIKYPNEPVSAQKILYLRRQDVDRKIIQVVVSLKAVIKPEYVLGGEILTLKDIIPLI